MKCIVFAGLMGHGEKIIGSPDSAFNRARLLSSCGKTLFPGTGFLFLLSDSFGGPRLSCLENTEIDPNYKKQFLKFQQNLLWRKKN